MMSKFAAFAVLVSAAAVGMTAHAAEVIVHGSDTVGNALVVPNKGEIESKSGHRLAIVMNGTGDGVRDLVAGEADIAMISAHLGEVVRSLNEADPGSVDGTELVATLVSMTSAAFVVHPSNPVTEIEPNDAIRIMTGRITNWNEVGGPDRPIEVIAEGLGAGTRAMVERQLLNGTHITDNAIIAGGRATDVVALVVDNPNAFGVANSTALNGGVKEIEIGTGIRQPLNMVTIGEPEGALDDVIQATRDVGFF